MSQSRFLTLDQLADSLLKGAVAAFIVTFLSGIVAIQLPASSHAQNVLVDISAYSVLACMALFITGLLAKLLTASPSNSL